MAAECWSVVMAKDLWSLLEAVPLITIYIYALVLFVCFFGRSFVVRIKYVNRSSRELEYVYWFLHGETAIYRRLCILMSSDGCMDKN